MDAPSPFSVGLPGTSRDIRPPVVLLGLLTALDAMAIDSYLPALPSIARDMGVDVVSAQVTLAVFLIGLAAGQLLWGSVSDRIGRRGPMIAGLVVYCAGSLGGALAPSIDLLIAARLLQAIGASAGLVLARAIVADLWTAREAARLYSIMMQTLGVTALVSPLLGGALLVVSGWRAIFLFLLVAGILTGGWSVAGIRESHPPHRRAMPGSVLAGYARLWRLRSFMLATGAAAAGIATMFATLAGSSFLFIDRFGWTSIEYSCLYAASSVAFVAVCQINTVLIGRIGDAKMLKIAVALQLGLALVMLALALGGNADAWSLALLWTLLMGNLGILLGNAVSVAMRLAPAECAGTASAMIGVAQFGAGALVSPLAGALNDLALSFAATTAGCAALAWLMTHLALRKAAVTAA